MRLLCLALLLAGSRGQGLLASTTTSKPPETTTISTNVITSYIAATTLPTAVGKTLSERPSTAQPQSSTTMMSVGNERTDREKLADKLKPRLSIALRGVFSVEDLEKVTTLVLNSILLPDLVGKFMMEGAKELSSATSSWMVDRMGMKMKYRLVMERETLRLFTEGSGDLVEVIASDRFSVEDLVKNLDLPIEEERDILTFILSVLKESAIAIDDYLAEFRDNFPNARATVSEVAEHILELLLMKPRSSIEVIIRDLLETDDLVAVSVKLEDWMGIPFDSATLFVDLLHDVSLGQLSVHEAMLEFIIIDRTPVDRLKKFADKALKDVRNITESTLANISLPQTLEILPGGKLVFYRSLSISLELYDLYISLSILFNTELSLQNVVLGITNHLCNTEFKIDVCQSLPRSSIAGTSFARAM